MRLPADIIPLVTLFFPESPLLFSNSTKSAPQSSPTTPSASITPISTRIASLTSPVVQSATASATAAAVPEAKLLLSHAGAFASSLRATYPDQSLALFAEPIWWWQSGSAVDALLTYTSTTGDSQYDNLLSNTLITEATATNDFMTVHATGNDDQAWWALAALTAAETSLAPTGSVPWVTLAQNVFQEQTARWDNDKCNGGMKWKILEGDGTDGWHYKSTIANGLFFQMATRLALLTSSADIKAWAVKSYNWTVGVGLISPDFDVYDGTDDAKGENGCVDVNHDMWSYNVGVFMYGSAVMAKLTGEEEWLERTKGFIASAKRNFVNEETGELWEAKCEADGSCDSDQVSFKGTLARWLGATAELLPDLRESIGAIMDGASSMATAGTTEGLGAISSFNQLEIVDAGLRLQGVGGKEGTIGTKRNTRIVAGRIRW
ncbi:glycoside hydrolase family 76 protein [Didymella exigua CBS 183.55]|uniref:mannan endo-1,6-alpha-mannosidase n=1 Tax=Didymella exigua CBS 183.55 TaxID=1150837 RepID=A0A6A5RQG5_9PLEO|nr:glycoside hydrolase family 76 protein [Didymella exigua CBS 183.55]KAF1930585.1 glycoside hydrolase family 76 protein [Didymella exigua CBS 183.55]